MAVNFSVKNVPDEVADWLRARAKANHRSLQGELLAVLKMVARGPGPPKISVEEALARIKALNFSTPDESTQIVWELRDARYGSWRLPARRSGLCGTQGRGSGRAYHGRRTVRPQAPHL